MSLVHIIGNGFDLNAGLPTRYSQFYDYYFKQDSNNPWIDLFKQNIGRDQETWLDLEVEFGKYCNKFPDTSIFDVVFEDMCDELKKYLQILDNRIPAISGAKPIHDPFFANWLQPEQFADAYWAESVSKRRTFKDVSVINFNYTKTIEKLLAPEKVNVLHVHGTLSGEISIGVNDAKQIMNKDFQSNPAITNALVKPVRSRLFNNKVVRECENRIENATLISIFGTSIGITDQRWWDLIGERVKSGNLKVIVFNRSESEKMKISYKKLRTADTIKLKFNGKSGPITANTNSNVTVISDSDMFKSIEDIYKQAEAEELA